MEAYAILGLYVACKYLDPDYLLEFHNVCDSTAAIKTYDRLMSLNRMELPNLPNSDVWRIIRFYLQNWGEMKQEHAQSHR